MSIETKTTTTKTLKVIGVGQHASDFKAFFDAVPGPAKIDINVSRPLTGETGSVVTTIHATWEGS